MLKYLIVQLDNQSTSFCHYNGDGVDRFLMPEGVLNQAIIWALKRNLSLHYLLPDYQLPKSYENSILKRDSIQIASFSSYYSSSAQVIVYQTINSYLDSFPNEAKVDVVLVSPDEINRISQISEYRLSLSSRLDLVLQGVELYHDDDISSYKANLSSLSSTLLSVYKNKGITQVNVLTDILFTNKMNNCGAGDESITVSPNGKFYVCPAFYFDNPDCIVGDLNSGLQLNNDRLYTLPYAPICKRCDSFQCRRCIWLNHKLTGEVNTPSKQQCVVSHIERNQSQSLLNQIREIDPAFAGEKTFRDIDYLDPFELFSRNR